MSLGCADDVSDHLVPAVVQRCQFPQARPGLVVLAADVISGAVHVVMAVAASVGKGSHLVEAGA